MCQFLSAKDEGKIKTASDELSMEFVFFDSPGEWLGMSFNTIKVRHAAADGMDSVCSGDAMKAGAVADPERIVASVEKSAFSAGMTESAELCEEEEEEIVPNKPQNLDLQKPQAPVNTQTAPAQANGYVDSVAGAVPAGNVQQAVFCSRCGTKIPAEASFCPKCGAPRPGVAVQPTAQPVINVLVNNTAAAGAAATATATQPAAEPVPPRRINKVTYIILALLLGWIGVNEFYAGHTGTGILCLLFCWTYIPAIMGLIKAIIAVTKPAASDGTIVM
ncbi:MAG: TM2 domain-containing protein [Succinivibrionaceae bacterium]|nr:TM2 domain-containing protein [Succinivibrionaceae bacterium]MDY6375629.1 TM2 domain-containing protein [Succinivibrionaceae bacterium]